MPEQNSDSEHFADAAVNVTPKSDGSWLMAAVEKIAIAPEEARAIVARYRRQIKENGNTISDRAITDLIVKKIIARYAKLAAASGGTTSLAGVVPGLGTAATIIAGGGTDLALCMKFQVDMTLCLCMAINDEMSDEDAKHMSYVIVLAGAIEHATAPWGRKITSKAFAKMVDRYLKGQILKTIKALFAAVGIIFTKKALQKAIPFGVGVAFGASLNFGLTKFIGNTARDFLWLEHEKMAKS